MLWYGVNQLGYRVRHAKALDLEYPIGCCLMDYQLGYVKRSVCWAMVRGFQMGYLMVYISAGILDGRPGRMLHALCAIRYAHVACYPVVSVRTSCPLSESPISHSE